jgi:hypothetical protein
MADARRMLHRAATALVASILALVPSPRVAEA